MQSSELRMWHFIKHTRTSISPSHH